MILQVVAQNAGIQVSHGVSYHGLALNCSTELSWFSHILPCGVQGKHVTSLADLLHRTLTTNQVEPFLIKQLATTIGFTLDHSTSISHQISAPALFFQKNVQN